MASGFFGDRQVSAENDRIDDLEATIQASANAERGPRLPKCTPPTPPPSHAQERSRERNTAELERAYRAHLARTSREATAASAAASAYSAAPPSPPFTLHAEASPHESTAAAAPHLIADMD